MLIISALITFIYLLCRNVLKSHEPVYQAIWADTIDFEEVLISPVMLQDHMPDKVLAALKKVMAKVDEETTSVNSCDT